VCKKKCCLIAIDIRKILLRIIKKNIITKEAKNDFKIKIKVSKLNSL